MTWWLWALVGLAVWLAVALAVGWFVGHMARIGEDD